MATENAEHEARLHQALEELSNEYLHHPDVSLIDIGFDMKDGQITGEVVLRIHVRKSTNPTDPWPFPDNVDGVPVIVVYADYKPESGRNES